MKLKKLTIHNIASIEQAEIDFSAQPLADEHLFLITGETGSGKSTIIDCLCLALYGKTPRLKLKSDFKYENSADKDVGIYDPKQLLRRGCGEGSVELTFDDNGGTPYTARWEVRRAYGKPDGAIQGFKRSLMTDDGSVCMTRNGEIDDRIHEIVGLDMEQFFRTVVLAQGKFAEFLNSKDKEKSDLLEKMTGTEIYSRVGKKIYDVFQQKANRVTILKGQMENITLLTDEQKAQIGDEMARCDREQAIIDGQFKRASAMARWVADKKRVEQDIASRSQELHEKQGIVESAEHQAKYHLATDWDNTSGARHQLKERQAAEQLIAKLRGQWPVLQQEYDLLCAALRAAVAAIAEKQRKAQELRAAIKLEEPNREMYEAMEQIKNLVRRWLKVKGDMGTDSTNLEKDLKRLPVAEEAEKQTQSTALQLEADIRKLQEQHEAMNASAIAQKKDDLNRAARALMAFKEKRDAVKGVLETLDGLKNELGKAEDVVARTQATLDGKRALRDKAKATVERMTDWNELLAQAQKSVHEGDTCPVCGNTITHVLVPRAESELEKLRQEYRQADDDLRQAEGLVLVNEKLVANYKKQIDDNTAILNKKREDCESCWQQAVALLAQCGRRADEQVDDAGTDQFITSIDAEVKQLDVQLAEADQLFKKIQQEQRRVNEANQTHHKAELALNTLKKSILYQRELINKYAQEMETLTRDLDGLIVVADWQQLATDDEKFIMKLTRAADAYKRQVNDEALLTRQIELLNTALPAMEQSKANVKGFTDNQLTTDSVPDDLAARWRTLESNYLQLNTQLDGAREAQGRAQQSLETYLAEHPDMTVDRLNELMRHSQDEINGLKQAHQSLNDAINNMKGAIGSLSKQLEDLKAQKPECEEENPDRLEEVINEKQAALEGVKNRIAELRAHLTADADAAKRLGSRQQELERATEECRQWEEFNHILGSSDGTTFRKIAQSYILGELLSIANGYLRQFDNRYELEASPGTLIILARDMIQGDLTSVNTLSGGECFMVSLALALALSSMTGKVFSVDTLFIDEGFGSLSPNYLDNVMDTLNRLYEMGGRRVGIISHVEMLKDRVATQIQVMRDPTNNTVSRVTVV